MEYDRKDQGERGTTEYNITTPVRSEEETRREMEEELYRKLDEGCGKKLIYKMARKRDEDSKGYKNWITDKNGKLVTDRKDVLKVWEEYFKELLNQRENSELELPSAVEGSVKLEEIGDAEVERAMKKVKRGRATGIDEVRVEILVMTERVGVRWTKAIVKYLHERGEDPRGVAEGVDSHIWKRKGDVNDPGKYRSITLLSHVLKVLERILDRRIRR